MKKKKNLSAFSASSVPSGKNKSIGIVVAEWNGSITDALQEGASKTLLKLGVKKKDIVYTSVPGAFELPLGAARLAKRKNIDAVICLGCIIQGETPHFDFISSACANGITAVGLKYFKPVIFGVLTTHTIAQAEARSGGKHGNKGVEAAVTALKMLAD